jgi:hypothetical protein
MEGLRLHAFRCGLLSFDGSLVRLNILQDGVGSFHFVFVFQELDVWRFVSWEPTVRFGSQR